VFKVPDLSLQAGYPVLRRWQTADPVRLAYRGTFALDASVGEQLAVGSSV
jgi:hypothetical protein